MDYTNFRSAIGGFRRSDVFDYIERTSMEHRQKLRELEKKNAALQAENDELRAALAAAAPDAASVPAAEPEPMDLDARELAAYRRAEAAERNARRRVAKLSEQVNALSEQTGVAMHSVETEAEAISAGLTQQTEALLALSAQTQTLLADLKTQIQALSAGLDSEGTDSDE